MKLVGPGWFLGWFFMLLATACIIAVSNGALSNERGLPIGQILGTLSIAAFLGDAVARSGRGK